MVGRYGTDELNQFLSILILVFFYVEESMIKFRFQLQQGRKYKIFRCPGCGQKIRIPRGHGKIQIHCRVCGNDFMGKS